ncbi:hypothetical protein GCM10009677_34300 [Sphaerisporangium rubeum]
MIDVGHPRSTHRNVGRSWLTASLTGALALGVLAATPGTAGAVLAPQDLGTKAVTLLPAAPVQNGFSMIVRRAIATTITLVSSRNPSKVGEAVTFTATVAGTGTVIIPTGNVVFRDNGVDIGTAPLEGTGQASFTTSALIAGNHSITAAYQGNVSFDPSTSASLIQQRLASPPTPAPTPTHTQTPQPEPVVEPETPAVVHDDDDDDEFGRVCRRFRHHRGEGGWEDPRWRKLRQYCEDHWHRKDDQVVLIDKGIRRHIFGHYDQGGGGREYWDSSKKRWIPVHRHERPHYKKEHVRPRPMPPRPPVKHFAVTG